MRLTSQTEVFAVRLIKLFSAVSLVASAPCVLNAQNPAPVERRVEVRTMGPDGMRPMKMAMGGMRREMMMMDAASMFLSHTGDLQLTDAQVTRLAAIARRAETRQKAMRARMDSAMMAMHGRADAQPRDGVGGGMAAMMIHMPMPTEAERKAQHEDDRDAFAVPTPDQLATAWEMMRSHHGR
jgi:hypothetical protein